MDVQLLAQVPHIVTEPLHPGGLSLRQIFFIRRPVRLIDGEDIIDILLDAPVRVIVGTLSGVHAKDVNGKVRGFKGASS